ncbi:hypothetical protein D9M72_606220 [compost metagenome]
MLGRPQLEHPAAQQRCLQQADGLAGIELHGLGHAQFLLASFQQRQVLQRQVHSQSRRDQRDGIALVVGHIGGTQHLVTAHHFVEAGDQQRYLQRPLQAHRQRHTVGTTGGRQLLDHPQAALYQRQACLAFLTCGRQHRQL